VLLSVAQRRSVSWQLTYIEVTSNLNSLALSSATHAFRVEFLCIAPEGINLAWVKLLAPMSMTRLGDTSRSERILANAGVPEKFPSFTSQIVCGHPGRNMTSRKAWAGHQGHASLDLRLVWARWIQMYNARQAEMATDITANVIARNNG